MKKTLIFAAVFIALTGMTVWAAAPQGDTLAEELAIKQLDQQNHAVSKVLEARGTVNYSGSTTGGPTWARPWQLGDGTSGSCSISGSGTAVHYNTQDFHVDTTGLYTMTATWSGFDGYLHLYELSFDPLDQCLNLIALNDDGTGADNSQIADQSLTAGVQYILIAGGFGNTDYGTYYITISGVGNPILGTVPVELMSFSVE